METPHCAAEEVRRAVAELNRAWREGRFDDLDPFFDDDVVMRGPGLKALGHGRAAVVDSYRQFMSQSRVERFAESNLAVDVWGDTAAASYDWEMTYEQNGRTSSESGQDMFVFVRRDAGWVAVLRVMLF